ncbi:MAG: site-2 protease family protein [Patescibacteria group bacterium]
MPDLSTLVFQLLVLLFSVIIHEVSHGLMALWLGDTTAKNAGRLTLNPLKHLEFFGSFFVPLSLYLLSGGAFVLGWAKPVPYNPYSLKNPKLGAGLIGLAGPLSNIIIASIFGLALKLPFANLLGPEGEILIQLMSFIIFINVLLAIFNLVPIPPLDGSNVLFALLPKQFTRLQILLERYGFFILLLVIFFGFRYVFPIVDAIYRFILSW